MRTRWMTGPRGLLGILLGLLVTSGFSDDFHAHAATGVTGTHAPSAGLLDSTTDPAAAMAPNFLAVGSNPGKGLVRLPGHVLAVLARAEPQASAPDGAALMVLTVTLRRDDQLGFEGFLKAVYDPRATEYRRFLSPVQIADRFGPSAETYASLRKYLKGQGLQEISLAANRLTLTVRGTRRQVERGLHVRVRDYSLGQTSFFANDRDPAVPASLVEHVQAVSGLSNLAKPHKVNQSGPGPTSCGGGTGAGPAIRTAGSTSIRPADTGTTCPADPCAGYEPGLEWFICHFFGYRRPVIIPTGTTSNAVKSALSPSPKLITQAASTSSFDGTGQTVGLLEFDTYHTSDVSDFLSFMGAPAGLINQLSEVNVNGGSTLGSGESEVLIDIDAVMTVAPGAKVVVYDSPFTGQTASYTALFNAMINGGVTIISNSWASCENQVSAADAQSIDSVLQTAAASGISVFNGAGDSGSVCLDGAANTAAIPASSPSATAVGGTSPTFTAGFTYGGETWWDGSAHVPVTGQGGFGVSRFFARPSYQSALNSSAMRSVPDVVSMADPAEGVAICQADAGGCPTGLLYGGTSLAAPLMAAATAVLNQALGKNVGSFNAAVYPLANTAAFHSAASMGSDFSHVGLGSPNLDRLYLALAGETVGGVSASASTVETRVELLYITLPPVTASADGTSTFPVVVRLNDSEGNFVGGKTVTLTTTSGHTTITPASVVSSSNDGSAIFMVTDSTVESPTVTATDTTDGIVLTQQPAIAFVSPPATAGGITANPTTVNADGQSAATITVTLKDALGNPTPGKIVAIQDGGAHAVINGPSPTVTDANGEIQFTATDTVNETVTFTAIDVTDNNVPVPGSAMVTYSNSVGALCGVGTPPTPAAGFSITPFITGFATNPSFFFGNVNYGCSGADNPIFTSTGSVLVTDFVTGAIYQLGLGGGALSPSLLLNTLTPAMGSLIYGKDGNIYTTFGGENAEIAQIDPTTGAVARVLATGLVCPGGLSVDPLSGDLFFDNQCSGGGTNNASVYRIIDPANSDPSRPTQVVVYTTLENTANGQMAFSPDGTLYAVTGYFGVANAPVEMISGTNIPTVTVTPLTGITSDYPVAIGKTNADGSAQTLLVEPAGTLSEVPIANPSAASTIAMGGPGTGVTGPDGCLYSAHYDTVYRIANSTGGCTFAPTSPAPALNLSPAQVSPNPVQGNSVTLTAQIHNVSPLSGVPVVFATTGANPVVKQIHTDANGNAVFTYTGAQTGTDTVTATGTANSVALTSNHVQVTWTAGKHATFLSLNGGPQAGTVNLPVGVIASLADISASPATALSGQAVTFTLGGSNCQAMTDVTGNATCQLTPSQAGSGTLTAGFAGTSQWVAATASVEFNVSAAPNPTPTVTITVNPTSITAGMSATLTWSSTGASSCAGSGAWSGAEPTSGALPVMPATAGTYTYVLSCTGAGGAAMAQAVLIVKASTKTTPVITWKTPAPITYGTPLSDVQLDATANVAGTFSYSPKDGTVLSAGTHALSVTFTPSNTSAYTTATGAVKLQVNQAAPFIVWVPVPIFQGTPLGLFQLDAVAFQPDKFFRLLSGRFVYTPKAGTVLSVGEHELSVTFTPDDSNFKTVTAHAELDVFKKPHW